MASPETPEATDRAILRMLLDKNFDLSAVAVLERRIGDRAAVAASLARLRHDGLIYEESVYGFVAATNVARRHRPRKLASRRGKATKAAHREGA